MKEHPEVRSKNNQLILVRKGKEDDIVTAFSCHIVKDITMKLADGSEKHFYVVRGKNKNGTHLKELTITAEEFDKMLWPSTYWGTQAVVINLTAFKNHVRQKILLRDGIKQEIQYQYIGFVKQDDGSYLYVDNAGCFTKNGHNSSIKSNLSKNLAKYKLPAPTKKESKIQKCIKAMLDIGSLSNNNHYIGLLCQTTVIKALMSVYLTNTSSHFLLGKTGALKSSVAAIIQSFHGPEFNSSIDLPENWASSKVSLQKTTTIIKHSIIVIDEFVPDARKTKELAEKAEEVLRGSANNASRTTADSCGNLRQKDDPEATILVTGETISTDFIASLLLRIIFFPVSKDDVNLNKLNHYQNLAKKGVLAMFSSLFVTFLLENQGELEPKISAVFKEYQAKATKVLVNKHLRLSENAASLMVAQSLLYYFAKKNGVIDKNQHKEMLSTSWKQILQLIKKQSQITDGSSLSNLFFDHLKKSLINGEVHLADYSTGGKPKVKKARRLGWKKQSPQGVCIGWYDRKTKSVYIKTSKEVFRTLFNLIPEGMNKQVPGQQKKFWKDVESTGGLSTTDEGRNTIRKTEPKSKKSVSVYPLSSSLNF